MPFGIHRISLLRALAINSDIRGFNPISILKMGFPGGSDSKESACNAGSWIGSLGWEEPLEKGMAKYSCILIW